MNVIFLMLCIPVGIEFNIQFTDLAIREANISTLNIDKY